jgi:hypothetical protein
MAFESGKNQYVSRDPNIYDEHKADLLKAITNNHAEYSDETIEVGIKRQRED